MSKPLPVIQAPNPAVIEGEDTTELLHPDDADQKVALRKYGWKVKLHTAAKVREEMAWLYNQYKRGLIAFDESGTRVGYRKITPEDARVLATILSKTNDILRDAVTDAKLRQLEVIIDKLKDGKQPTQKEINDILDRRAFQTEGTDNGEGDLADDPLED